MSDIKTSDIKTVAVVGLGYIGLPTAAIMATNGWNVIGVDVNRRLVEAVNRGEVPFVEPDLETAVASAVKLGSLRAQHEVPAADVYIVAVPTPFGQGHSADLTYVDAATDSIIPQLRGGELVILESTSPPGTTQHLADRIMAARHDLAASEADADAGRKIVHFAHCPERVLPGRIMVELVTNDRIIGGLTPIAGALARDLYSSFCKAELHVTDARTAEMAKLTENAFRDVNIAFANELSLIAERLDIDVWELIELANKHPRVNILKPGPGVGGHCIAVDPWFIVSSAPEESLLIRTARNVNDSKPEQVLGHVEEAARNVEAPRVAALGLAFKSDIDDLRESPALQIVEALAKRLPHASIEAVEPHIDQLPPSLAAMKNVSLAEFEPAVKGADIVVLLVDHTAFKDVDRAMLEDKVIIDTRGVWR